MHRPCWTSTRRRAENDLTVVLLVGLVLVLLLIVGGLGGLVAWQWTRAEQARRMVMEATSEARAQEAAARMNLERARQALDARQNPPPPPQADPFVLQDCRQVARLFAAPMTSPWPLVSLLHPEPGDPIPPEPLPGFPP